MSDQARIETAIDTTIDNCEVLRARLAKYEDAEGRPVGLTHDQAELVRLVRDLALRAGKHARPLIHAAALGLESQAREIERLNYRYQREVYGLNNEGDPIGGDPAGGYANDNARLRKELSALKAQPSGVVLPEPEIASEINRLIGLWDAKVAWSGQCMEELLDHAARAATLIARLNSSPVSAGATVKQSLTAGGVDECE